MSQVLIIANTFSVSILFRSSLLKKLGERKMLKGIFATARDYQSLDGYEIGAYFPKPGQSFFGVLKHLTEDSGVSVIHSFTHMGNLVAIFAAIFGRKKLVLSVTGMGRGFNHPGFLGIITRFGMRLFYFFAHYFASAIIVQNTDDYVEFKRLVRQRFVPRLLKTAGSGIPLDYFAKVLPTSHLDSSEVKIGFFSRALPQKGVSQFYSLASNNFANQGLMFIHVGYSGTNEFDLDRISHTAATSNVRYFGSTLDLRPWLLAVDIVVIPSSYREGLSRLLIESMLAGKIVIAKCTSGVSDHLKDGVNGFVYQVDADLDSVLKSALAALGGNIHSNAREYAIANFDVEKVDRVYFESYRLAGLEV